MKKAGLGRSWEGRWGHAVVNPFKTTAGILYSFDSTCFIGFVVGVFGLLISRRLGKVVGVVVLLIRRKQDHVGSSCPVDRQAGLPVRFLDHYFDGEG